MRDRPSRSANAHPAPTHAPASTPRDRRRCPEKRKASRRAWAARLARSERVFSFAANPSDLAAWLRASGLAISDAADDDEIEDAFRRFFEHQLSKR
jgi:hypothetical protein